MGKIKKYAWIVLVIACLANFAPNYAQYQLSPFAPQLMEAFAMSPTQFSSIFTAVMIPAIVLSLAAGILADRFGLKIVIGIGLIISAVGATLRIFAGGYMNFIVFMFLIGVGATLLNANSAKIIGSYFPREKNVSMMSVYQSSATLAMAVAMGTTSLLQTTNTAFIVAAVLSMVVALLWILFVKNPEKNPLENKTSMPQTSVTKGLKIVAKNKVVWLTAFCLMGLTACATGMNAFLPTALSQRGIDAVQAGMISAFMTIGNFVGCLLVPFIAGRIGKNKPVLIVCSFIGTLGAAFAWSAPQGLLLMTGLLLTGGAISGMIPLLMPIPVQLKEIGPAYGGTAGGFVCTIQLLGTVVIPSYIIAPITGANMSLYYMLCGLCVAMSLILVFFLPDFGTKAVTRNVKTETVAN